MQPPVILAPRRPIALAHRVVERAAPVVNGMLVSAAMAWFAIVGVAVVALGLLAWALAAPAWVFLALAAFGILLAAPVAAPVVSILAMIRHGRRRLRTAAAAEEAAAEVVPWHPRVRP